MFYYYFNSETLLINKCLWTMGRKPENLGETPRTCKLQACMAEVGIKAPTKEVKPYYYYSPVMPGIGIDGRN